MPVSTEEQNWRETVLQKLGKLDSLARSLDAVRDELHTVKMDADRRRDDHDKRIRELEKAKGTDDIRLQTLEKDSDSDQQSVRTVITHLFTSGLTALAAWFVFNGGKNG